MDNGYNPMADADGLDPKAWVPNLATEPFDDDDDDLYGTGAAALELEETQTPYLEADA